METMVFIPSYIIGNEHVDLAATVASRMVETEPEFMELLLMRTSMLPYLAIFLTMLVMLLSIILSKARKKARRIVRYPHSDFIIRELAGGGGGGVNWRRRATWSWREQRMPQ
ncbi:MAG: hypothetical protein J7J65_06080 [Candidatus Korarchaeota archaeon]|nr:hypothetical protein [Candidatus Korarchaeota archaeon]